MRRRIAGRDTDEVPHPTCTDKEHASRYGDPTMTDFPGEAEIREPLLRFLQDVIGPCRYLEPPTPMTRGNDTQVHSLRLDGIDEPLVLRVFQKGSDPRRPVFEATLQNALAEQGLPVPRARAIGSDPSLIGAPFFVMERSPGATLYGDAISTDPDGVPKADWRQILRQGGNMLFDMPRVFAEVCLRVHAVDTKLVVAALESVGFQRDEISLQPLLERIQRQVDCCGLEGLRAALGWLRESRPTWKSEDEVLCHCDVQPLNLLMEEGELCGIIDWANALLGPPELEVGWSRAMYLTLELPLPGPLRPFERPIARLITGRFTRAYARGRSLDLEAVGYFETFRSILTLSYLGEQAVLGESIRDAWNSAGAIARLVRHVRERAGVDVSIPWRE